LVAVSPGFALSADLAAAVGTTGGLPPDEQAATDRAVSNTATRDIARQWKITTSPNH